MRKRPAKMVPGAKRPQSDGLGVKSRPAIVPRPFPRTDTSSGRRVTSSIGR